MKYLYIILLSILLFSGCPTTTDPVVTDPVVTEPIMPVYFTTSGTTYYISSSSGDDSNNGLSESSPWKSMAKVNSFNFNPGDTVLFKSDDTFRGPLLPKSGTADNWIKYCSYGTGDKPKILGSTDILNDVNSWEFYQVNIHRSIITSPNYDIGSIYMDNGAIVGSKKWTIQDLTTPGDFFLNRDDDKLYLYTSNLSPAEYYEDIEVALTTHVVDIDNTSYVLFEDLSVTMGSAHGFGGSNTESIIIRNNDISYIGGGYLAGSDRIRYGNGIEFWSYAKNNLVDGNKIWEIFDTAVTNQCNSKSDQQNIYYINNILINCGLSSYELWNRPESSVMKDIYFIHNTSINPGHGWGSDRPDKNSFHVTSFGSVSKSENLVIKNNIFYTSETPVGVDNLTFFHLFFMDEDINNNYSNYVINNNIWNMPSPLWAVTLDSSYTSLKEWQEINSQSLNGILADPLFKDFDNGDYSPSSNSPVIDSGVATVRKYDFFGNEISGTPDIGAIEQ